MKTTGKLDFDIIKIIQSNNWYSEYLEIIQELKIEKTIKILCCKWYLANSVQKDLKLLPIMAV